MIFSDEHRFTRWFITVSSIAIVSIFLWNVSIFFNRLKKEEREKMEIWVNQPYVVYFFSASLKENTFLHFDTKFR